MNEERSKMINVFDHLYHSKKSKVSINLFYKKYHNMSTYF